MWKRRIEDIELRDDQTWIICKNKVKLPMYRNSGFYTDCDYLSTSILKVSSKFN